MIKKYLIDALILALLLLGVIHCRANEFIDNATIGALLGGLTGYFASNIKKISE